jgi:membrane peptidoglycan carboxypeptidase
MPKEKTKKRQFSHAIQKEASVLLSHVNKTKIPQILPYLFWLLPIAMIASSYLLIFNNLPSPTNLGKYDIPQATKIYDRNNKLIYDIYAEQNRTAVPLTQIPKHLQQATIAIEDKNFYSHKGINPIGGMLRAFIATITGKQLQGGSTITQQLVKSALLTPERSIIRKIKEIILSFWVEILYPKEKILEMYLNQVPYGGTAWGVETASEKYFGKNVKDLTLSEASLLAGLPQAPTLYSPFGAHPEYAIERQKEVLRRMTEDGYITKEQADNAKKESLKFVPPARTTSDKIRRRYG